MLITNLFIIQTIIIITVLLFILYSYKRNKINIPFDYWILVLYFFLICLARAFVFVSGNFFLILLPGIFGQIIYRKNRELIEKEKQSVDFYGWIMFVIGIVIIGAYFYFFRFDQYQTEDINIQSAIPTLIFLILFYTPASIGEEIIFRWLGTTISQKSGVSRIVSIGLFGFLFLSGHIPTPFSIIRFLKEIVFVFVISFYWYKYRNVWFCAYFHAIINIIGIIFGLLS
jgi:membrane protease YdiL (CAAX protease family)